jgi:hypothetical protein
MDSMKAWAIMDVLGHEGIQMLLEFSLNHCSPKEYESLFAISTLWMVVMRSSLSRIIIRQHMLKKFGILLQRISVSSLEGSHTAILGILHRIVRSCAAQEDIMFCIAEYLSSIFVKCAIQSFHATPDVNLILLLSDLSAVPKFFLEISPLWPAFLDAFLTLPWSDPVEILIKNILLKSDDQYSQLGSILLSLLDRENIPMIQEVLQIWGSCKQERTSGILCEAIELLKSQDSISDLSLLSKHCDWNSKYERIACSLLSQVSMVRGTSSCSNEPEADEDYHHRDSHKTVQFSFSQTELSIDICANCLAHCSPVLKEMLFGQFKESGTHSVFLLHDSYLEFYDFYSLGILKFPLETWWLSTPCSHPSSAIPTEVSVAQVRDKLTRLFNAAILAEKYLSESIVEIIVLHILNLFSRHWCRRNLPPDLNPIAYNTSVPGEGKPATSSAISKLQVSRNRGGTVWRSDDEFQICSFAEDAADVSACYAMELLQRDLACYAETEPFKKIKQGAMLTCCKRLPFLPLQWTNFMHDLVGQFLENNFLGIPR